MTLEQELQKFKFDVLRKMPFYGDILMRLNIVENNSFPTAATNGLSIMYNSKFMSLLSPGERNYVMMHEVFHVLLMHCKRNPNKNNKLWNVACDMVVNNMLDKLTSSMRNAGIAFERPRDGVFANLSDSDTVENIYQKLSEQKLPSIFVCQQKKLLKLYKLQRQESMQLKRTMLLIRAQTPP